jgi:hypothetical protein
VEFLKGKVRDLGSQAEGLRWQMEEMEEMNRRETAQLQVLATNVLVCLVIFSSTCC